MIRNRPILAGLAAVAVLVGGYLAYDRILRVDAVAPLALPSASASSSPARPERRAHGVRHDGAEHRPHDRDRRR